MFLLKGSLILSSHYIYERNDPFCHCLVLNKMLSYAKYCYTCGNIIVNNSCIQEESMNADDDNIIQSIIKR